jgi:hypothetical protein
MGILSLLHNDELMMMPQSNWCRKYSSLAVDITFWVVRPLYKKKITRFQT